MSSIAIIGGGVAGVTTALHLGSLGFNVTLFERERSLINGPPFCHLHAGGNLYREISDEQCIKLLKQSIDFAKFYPFVVDYRPTVIAIPATDPSSPKKLLGRLELLKTAYQKLIDDDPSNECLGESQYYYRCYTLEDIKQLKQQEIVAKPQNQDEWMIPVAHNLDMQKVQFPLIMVSEYGLNLFRLASGVKLAIEKIPTIKLSLGSSVTDIERSDSWEVSSLCDGVYHKDNFEYIINAAGFRTGKIDDMIGVPCKKMVEFKSAYVTHCEKYTDLQFPEIIFHGERGTPRGMGQFTPYPNGYFQLHGMTNDITLYPDGLVASTSLSCQPKLHQNFIEKIEKAWSPKEVEERSSRAIAHLSQFLPNFKDAKVGSKPLFGAQQITGDDPTLRVAEVSFPTAYYARCEIVKVSSVIDMVESIGQELYRLHLSKSISKVDFDLMREIKESEIAAEAKVICRQREYPEDLGERGRAEINPKTISA
ncbi:MAG: FAD-dependent oxidoreductase [Campylobacterota bacterium]|nr:FAD-dependent oxidoreductase [Campylobacterota bacterium]